MSPTGALLLSSVTKECFFTYQTTLKRVSKIDCHSRYLPPFNCKLPREAGCHLTFIIWPLNPNVAAEGLSRFFFLPLLAHAWDSVASLGYKELHLTGHEHPIQPVEVKMFSCSIHMLICRDVQNKVVVELTCILDSF